VKLTHFVLYISVSVLYKRQVKYILTLNLLRTLASILVKNNNKL